MLRFSPHKPCTSNFVNIFKRQTCFTLLFPLLFISLFSCSSATAFSLIPADVQFHLTFSFSLFIFNLLLLSTFPTKHFEAFSLHSKWFWWGQYVNSSLYFPLYITHAIEKGELSQAKTINVFSDTSRESALHKASELNWPAQQCYRMLL